VSKKKKLKKDTQNNLVSLFHNTKPNS
jgi:hypothetical protein